MRKEFIRNICNDLQKEFPRPGRKKIYSITNDATHKYPESFCDKICGDVIENDCYSVAKQIRCENALRVLPNKQNKRVFGSTGPGKETVKIISNYGCLNRFQYVYNIEEQQVKQTVSKN